MDNVDKNILIKLFDLFEINKKYVDMVCEAKTNPEAFFNKYDELRDVFVYPSDKLYVGVIEEILEQNRKALTLDWKADAFDIMKGLEHLDIIDKRDIIAMDLPSAIDKPMDGAFVCIIDYLKEYTDLSLIIIANNLDDNTVISIVPNDKLNCILECFRNCDINAFHYNIDYINDNMINTCELEEEIDNGFDIVGREDGPNGELSKIIIAEVKYCGTGRIKMTKTASGNQMSNEWVNNILFRMSTSEYQDTRNTAEMIFNNVEKLTTQVMVVLPNEETIKIENAFSKLNKNNYFAN
ncbi:MAG: hypothetical protein E7207_00825 [Clostridium butyricum]|nr:hypothetical protein [Clostridium butyricum]